MPNLENLYLKSKNPQQILTENKQVHWDYSRRISRHQFAQFLDYSNEQDDKSIILPEAYSRIHSQTKHQKTCQTIEGLVISEFWASDPESFGRYTQ